MYAIYKGNNEIILKDFRRWNISVYFSLSLKDCFHLIQADVNKSRICSLRGIWPLRALSDFLDNSKCSSADWKLRKTNHTSQYKWKNNHRNKANKYKTLWIVLLHREESWWSVKYDTGQLAWGFTGMSGMPLGLLARSKNKKPLRWTTGNSSHTLNIATEIGISFKSF